MAPAASPLPQSTTLAPPAPAAPAKRWGEGVQWPEAWRKPAGGTSGRKPIPRGKPKAK
jgi:hypothetical protein